jgi:branched-chain amino acid transport system ATP-binding protein
MTKSILRIDRLSKRFDGLTAIDNLTLDFSEGKLHAVIGPNGAGKTTLFNLITGLLRNDSGRIFFGDREITGVKPHKISRLGIKRTMQIKSVFNQLTVSENLWITRQSTQRFLHPFRRASRYRETRQAVEQVLEQIDMTRFADQTAGTLSYGDVAMLEIGMALISEPKLLLLDEPICGMSPAETERTVAKIQQLARTVGIIIIEHDMEVVFGIADEITVLAQGALLVSGTPKEIAENERVREAYLGRSEDESYADKVATSA